MSSSILVNNVSKKYGRITAISRISFSVNEGEIFGLIGPDGAGKSTLFRILATLLLPDSGEASILGFDVVKDYKKIRNLLGYMPGRFSLYQDLSVEENLNFFATIFKTSLSENYHLIRDIYIQLEPFKHRQAGKLSGGMKQKLALCCALIHRPEVLLLDEPTTGVDAVSRKEFWEMLKKIKNEGIPIIVSTPYMDEAAQCDRIALIKDGTILSIQTPDNLTKGYRGNIVQVKGKNVFELITSLRKMEEISSAYAFGDSIHAVLKETRMTSDDLANKLSALNFKDTQVLNFSPGIEDCFMELIENQN